MVKIYFVHPESAPLCILFCSPFSLSALFWCVVCVPGYWWVYLIVPPSPKSLLGCVAHGGGEEGDGRGREGEGVHDSHEASTEQLCVRQAGGRRQ